MTRVWGHLSIMLGLMAAVPLLASPLARADYTVGETYKVKISDLHKNQISIGKYAAKLRKEYLLKRLMNTKEDLKTYMKEHPGTAIVGPGGELYLKDGHHRSRILTELDSDVMYVTIIANGSDLHMADFRRVMEATGSVYLKDRKGRQKSWEDLPRSPMDFEDDPYRSLAWLARKRGGFEKQGDLWEFHFAELLRENIDLKDDRDETIEAAVPAAIKVAKGPKGDALRERLAALKRFGCQTALLW